MSNMCHTAYEFALKQQPTSFKYRHEIDVISGFTPQIKATDSVSIWQHKLLCYYFSLAMVKLNPALAICLMEEAGVERDYIEVALVTVGMKKAADGGYVIDDTEVEIKPPPYKDVNGWLASGEIIKHDTKPGDICVFNEGLGFLHKFADEGLYLVTGFHVNSVGEGLSEQRLIDVVRF